MSNSQAPETAGAAANPCADPRACGHRGRCPSSVKDTQRLMHKLEGGGPPPPRPFDFAQGKRLVRVVSRHAPSM